MATYFAEVINEKVKRVIVADQEFINSGKVGDKNNWVETFINGSEKYNYAGVGGTYDKDADAFINKKPFNSWILNNDYKWKPPIKYPKDGKKYDWDESTERWKESQL